MDNKIITLSNSNIELIILPENGGRIASLTLNGKKNILKSDSTLWLDKNKPSIDAFSDFKAYNGHINWIGPQSDWWKFQDLNAERKKNADAWPPDPFLTYAEYSVESQNKHRVLLKGIDSPVSQIRLEKEYAINSDGSIYINTTMINISKSPVSWDIWFNTRLDGFYRSYVPFANIDDIKVAHVLNTNSQEMPYSTTENFFSYTPVVPQKSFHERSSKTFIYPRLPIIAAFTDNEMLLIQFEKHSRNEIHPQQGLVEIYNHTDLDSNNAILELEYHSPYKKLMPNESFSSWEVWKVFEYKGKNNDAEHIAFLKEIIKKEF